MNIFDIVGPVMIGPSSSHTAGACRLGLLAAGICSKPKSYCTVRLPAPIKDTERTGLSWPA